MANIFSGGRLKRRLKRRRNEEKGPILFSTPLKKINNLLPSDTRTGEDGKKELRVKEFIEGEAEEETREEKNNGAGGGGGDGDGGRHTDLVLPRGGGGAGSDTQKLWVSTQIAECLGLTRVLLPIAPSRLTSKPKTIISHHSLGRSKTKFYLKAGDSFGLVKLLITSGRLLVTIPDYQFKGGKKIGDRRGKKRGSTEYVVVGVELAHFFTASTTKIPTTSATKPETIATLKLIGLPPVRRRPAPPADDKEYKDSKEKEEEEEEDEEEPRLWELNADMILAAGATITWLPGPDAPSPDECYKLLRPPSFPPAQVRSEAFATAVANEKKEEKKTKNPGGGVYADILILDGWGRNAFALMDAGISAHRIKIVEQRRATAVYHKCLCLALRNGLQSCYVGPKTIKIWNGSRWSRRLGGLERLVLRNQLRNVKYLYLDLCGDLSSPLLKSIERLTDQGLRILAITRSRRNPIYPFVNESNGWKLIQKWVQARVECRLFFR